MATTVSRLNTEQRSLAAILVESARRGRYRLASVDGESPSHESLVRSVFPRRFSLFSVKALMRSCRRSSSRIRCRATKTDTRQPPFCSPRHQSCQSPKGILIRARPFVFPASAACRHTHRFRPQPVPKTRGLAFMPPAPTCSLQGPSALA